MDMVLMTLQSQVTSRPNTENSTNLIQRKSFKLLKQKPQNYKNLTQEEFVLVNTNLPILASMLRPCLSENYVRVTLFMMVFMLIILQKKLCIVIIRLDDANNSLYRGSSSCGFDINITTKAS